MRVLITTFLLLLLLAAGFFSFISSGLYNVAASAPHSAPLRWLLATTQKNSVRAQAGDIEPMALDLRTTEKGFRLFDSLCVVCHGAPGVSPSEIAAGLRPEPPNLAAQVDNWTAAELFWIINNGFQYTGMPAFGKSHSEEDLWKVVVFLLELPGVTAEQYQQRRRRLGPQDPGETQYRHEPRQPPQPFGDEHPVMIHQQTI